MTTRKNVSFAAITLFLGASLATAKTPPTSQPAGTAISPLARVRYRQITQKDEIVCVLQNGMTVIAKRVASPVLAVRMRVGTGGVYEGKWLGGGLSHLLEHLVAGGSSQRRTEAQNKELLQDIGNNSNAYTAENETNFFVNTTPAHLDQAVDLVSGWVLGALITPAEYRREYQVVQRELEMDKGEPDREFWVLSQMNRYRVSPARVPVIGYQPVIQSLTRDDVYNYYKMAYVPENMIFSIAGDLDPEVMLATVQKYVGDTKPGKVFEHNIAAEPPVTSPRTIMATFPKLGQARLGLAFPSVKLDDPDMYPLDLLATILGDGDSSVLVENLRDKDQLVSSIGAGDDTPSYVSGTFEISMQLDAAKVPAATKAVKKIIEQIKKDGVTQEEMDRAKTQIKVDHARAKQTSDSVAQMMADDLAETGDPHASDKYVSRIAAVTAAQVQRVARKYLVNNRLITTALLPAEYVAAAGLPKAEDLIRPTTQTTSQIAEAGKSNVRKIELGDGTIVLLKSVPTSPMVSVQMFALGGLTAENAKTNGLGNLTMLLAMRGTKTRSAQQIAQALDSMGADLGAATNNNTWSWQGSCLKENLGSMLNIFGDVFNNANFPEKEIQPMKQRILAAIASENANWTQQAIIFFKKKFFGSMGSPYQFTTLGSAENVRGFTRDQIVQWYDQHVKNSRRVLAIYGDINLDDAEKLIRQDLGHGPNVSSAPANPPATEPAPQLAASQTPSIKINRVDILPTQQALAAIIIGFNSDSIIGQPSNFPIDVGQTMCAGYTYPTGYLFEVLRGRGLVYVVQAYNRPGRSAEIPGAFITLAGCQPANVNKVVDLMLENIARLQGTAKDMQEGWFHRAKRLAVTADALENETPAAQGELAALDELYGLGYNYHQHFADDIGKVTLAEVQQMARQRLNQCTITICTPKPGSVDVKEGTRTYTNFPPVELTSPGVSHGNVQ